MIIIENAGLWTESEQQVIDNFQVFFGMEFSLLFGAWKSKYHLPVKSTNSTLIWREINRQSLRIENLWQMLIVVKSTTFESVIYTIHKIVISQTKRSQLKAKWLE